MGNEHCGRCVHWGSAVVGGEEYCLKGFDYAECGGCHYVARVEGIDREKQGEVRLSLEEGRRNRKIAHLALGLSGLSLGLDILQWLFL